MIKIKPPAKPPVPSKPHDGKTNDGQHQAAAAQSTKQIAENAVHGGPKDVKKDKRMGVGRGQKG